MNKQRIRQFVMKYLQATHCHIIEKSPDHVTVELSVEADKDLTNRPYYWNFVERTGAQPETMKFTFRFSPQKEQENSGDAPASARTAQNPDSILGRYFGIVPGSKRTLDETLYFGSGRLEQIFQAVARRGKCVHLFETGADLSASGPGSVGYTTWLNVNFKVEFACDMKRDEICSLGISLSTGEIAEQFFDKMKPLALSPRLPAHAFIRETISYERALADLEAYVQKKYAAYDNRWALEAEDRLQFELKRLESYYNDLLSRLEGEEQEKAQQEFLKRKEETEWQHKPRIEVSAINCGLFHLLTDSFQNR